MQANVEQEIERFLHTGQRNLLSTPWRGNGVVERATKANTALRHALISAVRSRTRHAAVSDGFVDSDLVERTRMKVTPMVHGLFPRHEQAIMIDVLASSVVYLTPINIETVLNAVTDLRTAWRLANLYLMSCDAQLLSANAPAIIGLSEATTCYVSMRYFHGGGRLMRATVPRSREG